LKAICTNCDKAINIKSNIKGICKHCGQEFVMIGKTKEFSIMTKTGLLFETMDRETVDDYLKYELLDADDLVSSKFTPWMKFKDSDFKTSIKKKNRILGFFTHFSWALLLFLSLIVNAALIGVIYLQNIRVQELTG